MRTTQLIAGAIAGFAVLAGPQARTAELAKAQVDFFENKIRPILADTCYKCHNAADGKLKGGLALDTKEATLKGGDTGPAVVPGDPDKSLLIKAITYKDPDLQMPPKGEKLSDAQIADLIAWVKMGAPDPRTGTANAKYKGKTDAAKQHWAFTPVQKQTPPSTKFADRVQSPVDNFIFAKQESKGLAALRRTLGPPLARCRALLGYEGFRQSPGKPLLPLRVDLPRLRHRVVQ
jgi:mono/diheme cytochrome c family protein